MCDEDVNVNQSDPKKSTPSLSKMLEEPFRNVEIPDEAAVCNTVVHPSIFAVFNQQRMERWLFDALSPFWHSFPKGPHRAGPSMESTQR